MLARIRTYALCTMSWVELVLLLELPNHVRGGKFNFWQLHFQYFVLQDVKEIGPTRRDTVLKAVGLDKVALFVDAY